jgi:hypothetical protein
MECPICYINLPTYVINCDSKVEHKVCDQCEVKMRLKEPASQTGRKLKCPMCRTYEKAPGKRSAFSYEYELSKSFEAYEALSVRQGIAEKNRRDLLRRLRVV